LMVCQSRQQQTVAVKTSRQTFWGRGRKPRMRTSAPASTPAIWVDRSAKCFGNRDGFKIIVKVCRALEPTFRLER
jgi:hypothetical protein